MATTAVEDRGPNQRAGGYCWHYSSRDGNFTQLLLVGGKALHFRMGDSYVPGPYAALVLPNCVLANSPKSKPDTLTPAPALDIKDEAGYAQAIKEFRSAQDEIAEIKSEIDPNSDKADRTAQQASAITSIVIMAFVVILMLIST